MQNTRRTFIGRLYFHEPVPDGIAEFVMNLAASRRMARDVDKIKSIEGESPSYWTPDGTWGEDGEYYNLNEGFSPDDKVDEMIIDIDRPPSPQPSLNLPWKIGKIPHRDENKQYFLEYNDNGYENGNEGFLKYKEWLSYLITKVFKPNDLHLYGTIIWCDSGDLGRIRVGRNIIEIPKGGMEDRITRKQIIQIFENEYTYLTLNDFTESKMRWLRHSGTHSDFFCLASALAAPVYSWIDEQPSKSKYPDVTGIYLDFCQVSDDGRMILVFADMDQEIYEVHASDLADYNSEKVLKIFEKGEKK